MPAKYTEYLRELMRNEHTMAAITSALSTYPLYVSKNSSIKDLIPTRENLNTKILNHYKYREIGFDTVGRFLDELEITMCEIMPRYNELFKTVEIMAELPSPFDNVDVIETFEQETSNTATSQGTTSQSDTRSESGSSSQTDTKSESGSTSQEETKTETGESENSNNGTNSVTRTNTKNGKKIESDTPQSSISIPSKDIDTVSYGSMAEWNEDISSDTEKTTHSETSNGTTSSNSSSNVSGSSSIEGTNTTEGTSTMEGSSSSEGSTEGKSESTGTMKHTFTKKGNQGVNTYAHDMNEFRTSIIDVVDQIINDERIAELFMMVY